MKETRGGNAKEKQNRKEIFRPVVTGMLSIA